MGDEWQPIETAPKDGTTIIGWADDWPTPETIRWHAPWEAWVCSAVTISMGSEVSVATHWRPLPPPPND